MKVPFSYLKYNYITDNTKDIDDVTIFLQTSQNSKYLEGLDVESITPDKLIEIWDLDQLRVVGVTGTNGKTTVSGAIYSILLDLGEKVGLQGTRGFFANEERLEEKVMTTPSVFETIYHMKQSLDMGCRYFIMEVSSHAIEQKRIEGIDFALKIHTNVTADHLDYHKTIQEYRRVKSLFFEDESMKLLNKDDLTHLKYNPTNAYSYGVDNPATFKVQAFSLQEGITAYIKNLEIEATFHSHMVGLFNLYNLMAAIGGVSLLTKKPLQQICDVVEDFGGVAGRMEVISRDPLVIVDFAHTDDGILQVLQSMKDKKLSVVFGAGGNRDKLKRPRMGNVVGRFANKIYVTSDNPRDEEPQDIIDEIIVGLDGKDNVNVIVDRREAIHKAIDELGSGDALLILGKGDEDYQEIKGVKHHFDDREVVREYLNK
ncbi:MAG: UDP-N-acetylmuramoyl-L-alanyl-D-glutamate--2,6-diaminopimelate ligase [Sulfurovaceae bacterium]|nr:UDP-N-acetylmuramoyl-L-alanyl-D-glutamate--2,6-diaminopimelate ligase [Sulfurovaceae bacterium]MDD5548164.1 UDP-N-acetylmuramoyl-L-alanyl-D-glutamate--2,6-diaminopimelate ligase [Sulfurovaceae bacterium]